MAVSGKSENPDQRHPVRGHHVGASVDAAKGGVAPAFHDSMDAGHADIGAAPFIDPPRDAGDGVGHGDGTDGHAEDIAAVESGRFVAGHEVAPNA